MLAEQVRLYASFLLRWAAFLTPMAPGYQVLQVTGSELWAGRLEGCTAPGADGATLGSAVQLNAQLKGCTIPAWLPRNKEPLPVPEHQPPPKWAPDWGLLATDDPTDLWG